MTTQAGAADGGITGAAERSSRPSDGPTAETPPAAVASAPDALQQALDRLACGDRAGAERQLRHILSQPLETVENGSTVLGAARHLARICSVSGRDGEAIELLQGALLFAPQEAGLWLDLGAALLAGGDAAASVGCFEQSLALQPDDTDALHDLGVALLRSGQPGLAVQRLQELGRREPGHHLWRPTLARALQALAAEQFHADALEASLQSLQQAVGLIAAPIAIASSAASTGLAPVSEPSVAPPDEPPPPPAPPQDPDLLALLHENLGAVWHNLGRLPEARAAYERSLALQPERGEAHFHLALTLLLAGDWRRGWHHYAWRFRKQSPSSLCARPPGAALLDPEDPAAVRGPLLLLGEQGLGDMLQFLRYVPAALNRAPQARLCLPAGLHGLVRSSGLELPLLTPAEAEAPRTPALSSSPSMGIAATSEQRSASGSSAATGAAAESGEVLLPLLSLPRWLGMDSPDHPAERPGLQLPASRLQHWRQRLRHDLAAGERLIGLHWQGNPEVERQQHRGRSLPLELLAPLACLPGLRLLSLQRGPGEEQWRHCSFRHRFVQEQEDLDAIWDFVEIGAMASACDLILSSDSALAHLSGGLGLPTWLLLKQVPDWRWGLNGDSTDWYPAMRLFRQQHPGDWPELIARVCRALPEALQLPGS